MPEVLTIFTDCSNFGDGRAGSGIFISNYEEENKFSARNPNFCSAFGSGIKAAVTTKIYLVQANRYASSVSLYMTGCKQWILLIRLKRLVTYSNLAVANPGTERGPFINCFDPNGLYESDPFVTNGYLGEPSMHGRLRGKDADGFRFPVCILGLIVVPNGTLIKLLHCK
ncbi:hypothetical protein TNCV_3845281 [Trichonephila clavipes]|nr:hypothetical protein TNCV_3845281 [Trichonephila clavipes]